MDIDLDISPSKRPAILDSIRAERQQYFNANIKEEFKQSFGCTLVATFGTETSKAAIKTACKGYSTPDYPGGIDVDEATYLSSMVPSERGFTWSISDCVYGNADKGRKPVALLVQELNKYPGLLEIILAIEGIVSHRGSHASGVIFFDKDPFDDMCFMRTSTGDIITQFDLHDCEYLGSTKFDFLVTDIQDKLLVTIQELQNNNIIDPTMSIREVYNTYFHPNNLPIDDPEIWKALSEGSVINIFQFDSQVGAEAAKKIKPQSVLEMSDANSLMRLMPDGEDERPLDKYVKFKNDISLWYKEMDREGLTKEEQKTLEPYFLNSYGVPPTQEQLMRMLMDKDICEFSLSDANNARRIVGKKQMSKIPELHEQILFNAKSEKLGKYVWRHGVGP